MSSEPIVIPDNDDLEVVDRGRKRAREDESVDSPSPQRKRVIDLTEEVDGDERDTRGHSPHVLFSMPGMRMPVSFFPIFHRLFSSSSFISEPRVSGTAIVVDDEDEDEEDEDDIVLNPDDLEIIDTMPASSNNGTSSSPPSSSSQSTSPDSSSTDQRPLTPTPISTTVETTSISPILTPITPSSTSSNSTAPLSTVSKSNYQQLGQLECPVCLDKMKQVTATVCGHLFCLKCIRQVIDTNPQCPLCKRKLKHKDIHPIYV